VIDAADLLVMDDAHLAEHCLHSLFSVEIDRYSHQKLFESLVAELHARSPEYTVLTDALAGDARSAAPPELLSFLDQDLVAERLREIVDTSLALSSDSDLGFRWRRIRDRLREANIYLGLNKIWIRPYIYPLVDSDHYSQAKQRLYVSATIGDPGDLSRRLGVKPITKIPVDPEFADRTCGRRLIVMNRSEEQDIPPRLQHAILVALRLHPKSVWLCASQAEAEKYQGAVSQWLKGNGLVGHPTWLLTSLGDEIDQFKAASQGHLFVAGRFDGMDFRADECRLIVVTTLPRAINLQEEFICAYLRDGGFMRKRLNQRIVQALGRCNRADDDFGVYVLADRRFATHFGRESNREGIPANMVAEIDMAQDSAEIQVALLGEKVAKFLGQQFSEYDVALHQYRASVPTTRSFPTAPDTSKDEVAGWQMLFHSQNYNSAAHRFGECWKACERAHVQEMGAFHKWTWAKALHLQSRLGNRVAGGRSLELLDEAIRCGGASSWFNRMQASLNRARNVAVQQPTDDYRAALVQSFDDLLEHVGARGDRFEKFCQRISQNLQSDKHGEYCEGLEQLGIVLGYQARRPKGKAATDNRWRGTFGNVKELVTFEVKVQQQDGKEITPKHMGQAHNQMNRALAEFGPLGYVIRGSLVTHLTNIDPAAKSAAGKIRIVPKSVITRLWERVRLLLSTYRDRWSLDDVAARAVAAQAIHGKCPPAGWLLRALESDTLFVDEAGLLAEWRA
jgi:hypothetical protein